MKNKNKTILLMLIILFLFIILLSCITCKNNKESLEQLYDNYHIVCARYNKPCEFLDEIPIKYTIIQKDVDVPNVGNEATSFLYYIIKNYESLPENIIFIHDENSSWHHTGKITEKIFEWIKNYEVEGSSYYEFNNMIVGVPLEFYNENNYIFKNFYDKTLISTIGTLENVTPKEGKCCAQFIVSKERILFRTKQFYENIYIWILENANKDAKKDDNDSNFKIGVYLEYTWRFIFNGING